MKRVISLVLILSLVLCSTADIYASGISAEAYVLMEADSGRVIAEHCAHKRKPIASITKLMTALVALESGCGLEKEYEISGAWTGAEGSSVYLKPGEQVSLETLLYGMLLRSGNDAALAVAGICGGSVENFVVQMNRKANALHMKDSHFENPNGLHREAHYSSAYDMALLARACLKNERLAEIVSTRTITLGSRTFTNHNKLLWRYPGCIGMKTGYTESAGRTLVSAARRNGVTLICVTLNAPSDWNDHEALLDRGFTLCHRETLIKKGEPVCRVPVKGSLIPFAELVSCRNLDAVLIGDEAVEQKIILENRTLDAPLQAGSELGRVLYRTDHRALGEARLVTPDAISCHLADRRLISLFPCRK